METLLSYLISASAGIVLFYSVYWLFLRKETFHQANRFYLLAALLTAALLPVFPLQYRVLIEAGTNAPIRTIADTFKNIPVTEAINNSGTVFNWQHALLIVYLTGASIFMLRLLIQTAVLLSLMIKHRMKSFEGVRIIENEKYGLPFSFFNVIFINPKFHTQDDLPEILAHEKVHIRENHWFDLLFIELLTVIFWFNPFIWFFERSIKQNHEYLADKGVLAQGHTVARYQALLVNQLMGMQIIGITNNLNFALNANRLKMMTKKRTPHIRGVKFMWALPALALLLFAFAEPEYQASNQEQQTGEVQASKLISQKNIKLNGVVTDEDGDPMPGTSVLVKGGTVGTVVDKDGTFSLDVPEKSSIVLSFVGKETLVEHYTQITSGEMKEGAFYKEYVLRDAVILIGPAAPASPPPPPPPGKKEKLTPPPPPPPASGEKEVFIVVEDMPEYPGGSEALGDYVYKMQQKIAQEKGVKGKAKVAFTVNAAGKVTDIKVVEKDNDAAAKGAVAIASNMPEWKPGKQRGKAVPVKYLLPVEFK
ncbi:energy transducer TonB [Maribellus sp. CM-23]|uniref:M56 family metallopeptidase n=1 Tax=Maribellus sp. CM-23 TaxID=2781026 RepID=UPI001F19583A|nr:M56 family metallopeptidase [Maribellus sp. CM-23]MCE4566765.1 energy transducer TonB [Maribellus sp. CM-23]